MEERERCYYFILSQKPHETKYNKKCSTHKTINAAILYANISWAQIRRKLTMKVLKLLKVVYISDGLRLDTNKLTNCHVYGIPHGYIATRNYSYTRMVGNLEE
jgi:hypothetical protein